MPVILYKGEQLKCLMITAHDICDLLWQVAVVLREKSQGKLQKQGKGRDRIERDIIGNR